MMQSERDEYVSGKACFSRLPRQVSQLRREQVGGVVASRRRGLPPIAARLVQSPTLHVIFADLTLSFWTPRTVRFLPQGKTAGHRGRGEGEAQATRETKTARAGVGEVRFVAAEGQGDRCADAWSVSRARGGQPSAEPASVNGGVV